MEYQRQDEAVLNRWAAAAQAGDAAARAAFLQQFQPLIQSTAVWLWQSMVRSRLTQVYDRDDMAQEAQRLFLELVLEHNPGQGRSFTPFIVTMLRWRARNFLSQAQRGRTPGPRFSIDDETIASALERLSAVLSTDEALLAMHRVALRAALQQLTLRQRRLLYLHYWLDVPVLQLAAAWRVSPQAIRQALQRAETSLRRILEAETATQRVAA